MQTQSITEAIDCHNGWYSLQEWQDISLASLLEKAELEDNVTGIRMTSVTCLSNTYPMEEALSILLATHVSGEVLDPFHGFPLRAVVPGRRAWFWLKWLVKIEVLLGPLEVVSGILYAPSKYSGIWKPPEFPRISSN